MSKLAAGFGGMLGEIRQLRGTNVWIFIVYGLLFDTLNNLWRPFAIKFLERLGGSEFEIAMLSALPGLVAALVLLPGAILFRKFTNQKRATATFILISRLMLVAIAFIPALPPAMQPMLFVVLIAVMNCPDSLSQTSLQSFLGTIFSGNMRGQAIALRTKFGQAFVPIVTILSGLAITFIPRTNEQRIILYQIFFIGAFLLGILEVMVFNRLQVPDYLKQKTAPPPPDGSVDGLCKGQRGQDPIVNKEHRVFAMLKAIAKDKKFIQFLVPTIVFAFTWQAAWPLLGILQVIHLGATELWLALFGLVTGVCAFISGSFWQRILRKYGNNTVFVASGLLIATNSFLFALAPNVQVLILTNAFSGFSLLGIQMAMLNGTLEATPDENRMTYLATFNTIMNLSLFTAPFLAHFLLSRLGVVYALFVVGGMRFLGVFVVWACNKFKRKDVIEPV